MTRRLVATWAPRRPRGVAIILHGGGSRTARTPVSATQPSVVRMIPTAVTIAARGRGHLAVYRLLNSTRGWDAHHPPTLDVDWAIDQVAERYPEVPVALVGHSLGGRAAILGAVRPEVPCVVALAPYLYPIDGQTDLEGRDVLMVHGADDRVASLATARRVAEELGKRATVTFSEVAHGPHSMLRHARQFDGAAADFVAARLLAD